MKSERGKTTIELTDDQWELVIHSINDKGKSLNRISMETATILGVNARRKINDEATLHQNLSLDICKKLNEKGWSI